MGAEVPAIVRLSTSDVAPADRLSYWSSILRSTFTPVSVDDVKSAAVRLGTARPAARTNHLRCTAGIRATYDSRSPGDSSNDRALFQPGPGIQRFMARDAWRTHRGSALATSFSTTPATRWTSICRRTTAISICSCRNGLFARWVPNPAWLVGRRIAFDSHWGHVLASFVAQLSPEFVSQAPLPQSMLIDQVGALLALTANELRGDRAAWTPRSSFLTRQGSGSYPATLYGTGPAVGRHCEFAQHLKANPASGARNVRGNLRRNADPGARRCRRSHAAIAPVRSRHHGGNRSTRRILGRLSFHQGAAQAERADAYADATSQAGLAK